MVSSAEMMAECWVWYGVAMSAVAVRFVSQYMVRKRNFIKNVPVDDFLMFILIFIYTAAIVSLFMYFDIIEHIPLDNNFTPEENYVMGRKLGILNILAETSIQTTLWGNKGCLLLLYNRLTLFGHQAMIWKVVSAYIILAYMAVIIALYGGWCRPFSDYLVLQPGNMECLTWTHYNILQLTLNLSTDLILLIIPVIMISRLRMKIGKKLLLVCLFSLGIFVMLAAILTKVNVFENNVEPVWFLWCVREVSTAMLVGNLALCMPIARTVWFAVFPRTASTHNTTGAKSATSAAGLAAASKRSTATTEATGGTASSEGGESSRWGASPARSSHHDTGLDMETYGKVGLRNTTRRVSVGEESV
ncbi:hypothetical protein CTRI78_v011115 [Colletotrichum trifolii]|uniref:Rhodopsin domain-containing protein n=1 Tax=Colletotrichum trifolii TaxID=5466 RepID=A0A4R8QSM2_COLTR|nr:hypothetical protein CTRI78_v011115 [Colletotrichum trifolii]